MKCGGKGGQEVNKVNVSVLEGTVEKQWYCGTVKFLPLGMYCPGCLQHSLSPVPLYMHALL